MDRFESQVNTFVHSWEKRIADIAQRVDLIAGRVTGLHANIKNIPKDFSKLEKKVTDFISIFPASIEKNVSSLKSEVMELIGNLYAQHRQTSNEIDNAKADFASAQSNISSTALSVKQAIDGFTEALENHREHSEECLRALLDSYAQEVQALRKAVNAKVEELAFNSSKHNEATEQLVSASRDFLLMSQKTVNVCNEIKLLSEALNSKFDAKHQEYLTQSEEICSNQSIFIDQIEGKISSLQNEFKRVESNVLSSIETYEKAKHAIRDSALSASNAIVEEANKKARELLKQVEAEKVRTAIAEEKLAKKDRENAESIARIDRLKKLVSKLENTNAY